MKSNLLENEITQPAELRDFFEWHQGVKNYGFWAIEIQDQDCLTRIKNHQQYIADKIHPGYSRQPHITLVAAGLLSNNFFSQKLLTQQVDKIQQLNFSKFPLYISNAKSFTTCPYLSILDPEDNLPILRDTLNSVSPEEGYGDYTPHVTLGFYNNRYKISDILTLIPNTNSVNKQFIINDIIFAQYKTKDIQGPYKVIHRIHFNDIISDLS